MTVWWHDPLLPTKLPQIPQDALRIVTTVEDGDNYDDRDESGWWWERPTAINGDLRWWWLCEKESKGEPHYCGDSLISPTSPQWPNLLISITSISPTRKIFSPQNRIPQLSKLACSRWTAYCRWQNSFENIYQLKLEAGKSPEHFTL